MENRRFGYGIRIALDEETMGTAVACAEQYAFDWIAVDLDWGQFWVSPAAGPDYRTLDRFMNHARNYQLRVMISIAHAPDWAQTTRGPSVKYTSALIAKLLERYPTNIHAIELFPGANTHEGWGREPDPAKYAALLKGSQRVIERMDRNVSLIAGGFVPTSSGQEGNMRDTQFLRALYQQGMREENPIIGVKLPRTTGHPDDGPTLTDDDVIRHYEQVRQVMLENEHRNGLIWMTSFSLPDSLQTEVEGQLREDRSQWLQGAYLRLRSQLFIEVAFYQPQSFPSFPYRSSPNPLWVIDADGSNYIQTAMEVIVSDPGEIREEFSDGSPPQRGLKKLTKKTLLKVPPP